MQSAPKDENRTAVCDVCSKPNSRTVRYEGRTMKPSGGGHFVYPKALINSAAAGCISCLILSAALDHFWPKWRKITEIVIDLTSHPIPSLKVASTIHSSEEEGIDRTESESPYTSADSDSDISNSGSHRVGGIGERTEEDQEELSDSSYAGSGYEVAEGLNEDEEHTGSLDWEDESSDEDGDEDDSEASDGDDMPSDDTFSDDDDRNYNKSTRLETALSLVFFTASKAQISPSSMSPKAKTTARDLDEPCALLSGDIRQNRRTESSSGSEIADKSLPNTKNLNSFWEFVTSTNDTGESFVSSPNFQRLIAWLDHCSMEHVHCHAPTRQLPTRVINVFPSSSNKEQALCTLYVSKGEKEKYMALSHCWGKRAMPTTTTSNINERVRGIPWEVLSKTFQEAIELTKALGITYLWIDSLCIVQDDEEDWARESAKMQYIYENAYLTLAATASENGTSGLFVESNEKRCKLNMTDLPATIQQASPSYQDYPTIIAQSMLDHGHISRFSRKPDPLASRGWCFQERLLSRCIIHFSSRELIWECKTSTTCECHCPEKNFLGPKTNYEQLARLTNDEFDFLTDPKGEADTDNLWHQVVSSYISSTDFSFLGDPKVGAAKDKLWHYLISYYTKLKLTFEKDTLPAFSGIAHKFIEPQNYLAGVRKDRLIQDLIWRISPNFYPEDVPDNTKATYCAPTWFLGFNSSSCRIS